MATTTPKFSPVKTPEEKGLARDSRDAERVVQALRSEGYTVAEPTLQVGWWRAETNARSGTITRVRRLLGLE